MKRILLPGALLGALALFGGCAMKHDLGGLYEGIQAQNRLATPPSPCEITPLAPSYDEYLRQRGEVIRDPPAVAGIP